MKISNHQLEGDKVVLSISPNHGGAITPRFLIIHFTAGSSAKSSIDHFMDSAAEVSAHLVIGRDGSVCQLVPFNIKAWHAGVSAWGNITGLNSCSIGIELDNAGRLTPVGGEFQAWFGRRYPASEAIQARHKNESTESWWHTYTEPQLQSLREVASLLVSAYGLEDILGHDDIAPGRKTDPGPAFPMASFKAAVNGRREDAVPAWKVAVSKLNIRKGPGTEFDIVRPPLAKDTALSQLDITADWLKVALADNAGIQGWVNRQFVIAQ